jgi:hypothetical protein
MSERLRFATPSRIASMIGWWSAMALTMLSARSGRWKDRARKRGTAARSGPSSTRLSRSSG